MYHSSCDSSFFTFCPLGSIGWLSKRMPEAFFVLVGSQSCAHFLQSHSGFRMFGDMRFACAIIDERDINAPFDNNTLEKFIGKIIQDEKPDTVFLVGSCVCEVMKIDLPGISRYLSSRLPVPVLAAPINGIDSIWTQGEDAVLSSLADRCPNSPSGSEPGVVFVGTLSPEGRKALRRDAEESNVRIAGFLPPENLNDLPAIGESSIIAPLYPHIIKTVDAICRKRKCRAVHSLYPFGPHGTRFFFDECNKLCGIVSRNARELEEKTNRELCREKEILEGKKVFFIGDMLLELPLARFLLDVGASVMEVGTPYIHDSYHSCEKELIHSAGVRTIESPDYEAQLDRIESWHPDLIVAPLSCAWPLENAGFRVVWSIKFVLPDIIGFSNSWRLLSLFTSPFKMELVNESAAAGL